MFELAEKVLGGDGVSRFEIVESVACLAELHQVSKDRTACPSHCTFVHPSIPVQLECSSIPRAIAQVHEYN